MCSSSLDTSYIRIPKISGSAGRKIFEKSSTFLLALGQTATSIVSTYPRAKNNASGKVLLCIRESVGAHKSEDQLLLGDTLNEFVGSNTRCSLDYYYFDKRYRPWKSVDKDFINTVIGGSYEVVILGTWQAGSKFFWLPSPAALKTIRSRGVKIIVVWFDTASDSFLPRIYKLLDLFDLHVLADNPLIDLGKDFRSLREDQKSKIVAPCMSLPQNFIVPKTQKSIDLAFLGSVGAYRSYRKEYIMHLMRNNVPIFQNTVTSPSEILPWDEYTRILSDTKMVLNFSYSVDKHQLKGRAIQAFWSRAMLLESENDQTSKYFTPYIDYIPYSTKEDLLEKVNYYRVNSCERTRIADNGFNKVQHLYTSFHLWDGIFSALYSS